MFDNRVVASLKKVLGWRNHWDLTEIPALPVSMNESESGEYYQDYHPALRLDYIQALLPPNQSLDQFLDEKENQSITQLLNDAVEMKKLGYYGNDIVSNDLVYNTASWIDNQIMNEGRFVGVSFCMDEIGVRATINRIGLHLTSAQPSLDLYLYNSHKSDPVAIINFASTTTNSFAWIDQSIDLDFDSDKASGGVWYLGYYQDDLVGNAIRNKDLTWGKGYCNTCDNGRKTGQFMKIAKHLRMMPFYVPAPSLDPGRLMFDPATAIETSTNNWGFNFNISLKCDLTQFWIDNRKSFKTALGKKMALEILKMMKYSSQINRVEENLKILIIRDLEGDVDTKAMPLWKEVEREIKAINLDHSNLNSLCLPCAKKPRTFYGAI